MSNIKRLVTENEEEVRLISKVAIKKTDLPAFQQDCEEFSYIMNQNPQFTETQRRMVEDAFNSLMQKKYGVKE
jgi:hypothetical protein